MPPVNRNHPRRAGSSESKFAVMEFLAEYPDDAACLDYLWRSLYSEDGTHYHCPACDKVTTFHRVQSRPLYSCAKCGKGIHPTKGTIFEKSSTSLHLWFYGIYIMSSTRCGVSAKQLERELGVTYKTAWRMFNKIRSLLGQEDDEPFEGTIEMDHAYVGGKAHWRSAARSRAAGVRSGSTEDKATVFGMAQRGADGKSGKVRATMVKDATMLTTMPHFTTKVLPASSVYTDEDPLFRGMLKYGYQHGRVHHKQKVYVAGDVHVNTIEGFWSLMKRGIGGVYHSVSEKHLQSYIDEYVFRYNNRDQEGRGMFTAFLDRLILKAEPRLSAETPSEAQS